MYYQDTAGRAIKELLPGIGARTFWGENLMLALVDLAAGATLPNHAHPHEQAGIVLSGELVFIIGGERKLLKAGDLYIIPGGVEHSVQVGAEPAQVLDVFSPVREEYKY